MKRASPGYAQIPGHWQTLLQWARLLRKASDQLNLIACAISAIHPVEMLCDSIDLPGRVLDRLLRAVGRDLGLLSRGTRSICRGLSLLGFQLGLLGL
jgi:hypothetical protein